MTEATKPIRRPYLAHLLLALFFLELAAFAALQYLLPHSFQSLWNVNKKGVDQFAMALLGRVPTPLSDHNFRLAFRVLLVSLYVTYALGLIFARRLPAMTTGKALAIVAAAGAVAAVLIPPSLSSDIYSYVAYARLPEHGLNPYFHSPQALIDAGDPIARFLPRSLQDPTGHRVAWNIPTVYGPVWTMLAIAVTKITGASHLWGALMGMKLIELGALLVAALSAGRIARRLDPKRAATAILTIGLNPLALIEGVGSGHNDLLMIAFALLAAAWLQERRPALGGLALGISIGVKFITLGLLPWLLIDLWKSEKLGRWRAVGAACAGAIAPTVLCYAPFWHGLATLGALANRSHAIPKAAGAAPATDALPHSSLLLTALHDHQTILILYAALTLAVAFSRLRGVWVLAWAVFSSAFIYYSMGIWFPWYVLWPWLVVLACGLRVPGRIGISIFLGLIALALSSFYAIFSGTDALKLLEGVVLVCFFLIPAEYYACLVRKKKYLKNI
ncbi:MAG: polyprenol phosphomannose-dependent alpha 1,6 mannosyltransferase MptB [Capsulimonas sp.]|uniref:polyprenol phosphomannose-dependent alpha 1,6 mannosyltransferase MptB n=1 Tax=Capsulimonas sp. TaxID=2494211 RepID=UPI003265498F